MQSLVTHIVIAALSLCHSICFKQFKSCDPDSYGQCFSNGIKSHLLKLFTSILNLMIQFQMDNSSLQHTAFVNCSFSWPLLGHMFLMF